jgi:hypothetical protein
MWLCTLISNTLFVRFKVRKKASVTPQKKFFFIFFDAQLYPTFIALVSRREKGGFAFGQMRNASQDERYWHQ